MQTSSDGRKESVLSSLRITAEQAKQFRIFKGLEPIRPKKELKSHYWKGYTFKRQEDIVHFEAVQYLKAKYPEICIQSNHFSGMSLRHKNNRTKNNAILKNLKRFNGTKGMPDIIIFCRQGQFANLCLELKKPGGSLTKEEKEAHIRLASQGSLIAVVGHKSDSIESAVKDTIRIIESYMKGDLSNV